MELNNRVEIKHGACIYRYNKYDEELNSTTSMNKKLNEGRNVKIIHEDLQRVRKQLFLIL